MEIQPGLRILNLALWLEQEQALILNDFHLGYEESLLQKGLFLPKQQSLTIRARLKELLQVVKPKIIIINGDLKHEFGRVLKQEWREVLALIDFLAEHCQQLVLVRGNHDPILGPIAEKRNLLVVKEYQLGRILIVHGDKIVPKTEAKTIIIGHEHPAISLREKSKVEKFKCFLSGKWQDKRLIVMPSFNPLLEGTDILKEKLLSPYLKKISDFKVFIVNNGEAFDFGKVKDLQKHQN